MDAAHAQVFKRCVEDYDPQSAEDFQEGPPLSGFRNLTECIRLGVLALKTDMEADMLYDIYIYKCYILYTFTQYALLLYYILFILLYVVVYLYCILCTCIVIYGNLTWSRPNEGGPCCHVRSPGRIIRIRSGSSSPEASPRL